MNNVWIDDCTTPALDLTPEMKSEILKMLALSLDIPLHPHAGRHGAKTESLFKNIQIFQNEINYTER